mgnify:CR=1 FL=1
MSLFVRVTDGNTITVPLSGGGSVVLTQKSSVVSIDIDAIPSVSVLLESQPSISIEI